jgi:Domain of unknown function (DUF2019)
MLRGYLRPVNELLFWAKSTIIIVNKLINEYIKLAVAHGETALNGNSKTGNKLHSQIMKLVDEIKHSKENVRHEFYQLMYHENDSVKIWTAVTLLRTFEKNALEVLKEIQKSNTSIIGLSAKTTIDIWQKGMINDKTDWNSLGED